MRTSTEKAGISFARFVAALVTLWVGGSGPASGQGVTDRKAAKVTTNPGYVLLLLAAIGLWPTSGLAQTILTPQPGPALNITHVDINIGPGDHFDPHVNGDLAVYTSGLAIHYYRFSTAVDTAIPLGTSLQDLLSDTDGTRVVFSRVKPDGTTAVYLYDTDTGALTEIDPTPLATRFSAVVAGDSVAYIDSGLGIGGELVVHDLSTGTSARITNDSEFDISPNLSPDGDTVVWQHCVSSYTLCDIWKAVKSNGTWSQPSVASNDPADEELPDTNGSLIAYYSDRPSGDGDIFLRTVSGTAEVEVALPGVQINPNMAGNLVVFESRNGTPGDILLYNPSQNLLYNLTNTSSINEELNDISVLPSGDIVVVYDSDEAGAVARHVHALRFTLPPSSPPQMPGMASHMNPTHQTATIEFALPPISQGNVTFLCSLDHEPFVACTSPVVYPALLPGLHIFQVEAQDSDLNVGYPATSTFTISSSPLPPSPVIVSSPANPTNQTSAIFTYSDSQRGVTFQCSLDGQAYSPCAASGVTYTVSDGSHTFAVEAVDSDGTASVPASYVWVVDTAPPFISIVTPAGGASYALNSAVNAQYSCTDGGTGVATCAGAVANGAAISNAVVGRQSFTVNARDDAGNSASQSASYTVSYNVCPLYDSSKAKKSGSTYPIQIQLCDATGHNASSSGIIVHAVSVTMLSTSAPGVLDDAGNSNPDFDFRYDSSLGGYIFNLKTTGYSTGTYNLNFYAGSDPALHSAAFQIK